MLNKLSKAMGVTSPSTSVLGDNAWTMCGYGITQCQGITPNASATLSCVGMTCVVSHCGC